MVVSFNETFIDKAILTVGNLEQSSEIYKGLQEFQKETTSISDEKSKNVLDSISASHGIDDSKVFLQIVKITASSFDIFAALKELDKVEEDTQDYKMSFNLIE